MHNTFTFTQYLGIKIISFFDIEFLFGLIDIRIFTRVKKFFKLKILHFLFIIFPVYQQISFFISSNTNI